MQATLDHAVTDKELNSFYGTDEACTCTACIGELQVCNAIRAMPVIDCAAIAQIFSTLAAKMKQAGFSDFDIDLIDEMSGAICGEQA